VRFEMFIWKIGIAIRKPIIKVKRKVANTINNENIIFENGCAVAKEFLISKRIG
jgi:hypothetical protein